MSNAAPISPSTASSINTITTDSNSSSTIRIGGIGLLYFSIDKRGFFFFFHILDWAHGGRHKSDEACALGGGGGGGVCSLKTNSYYKTIETVYKVLVRTSGDLKRYYYNIRSLMKKLKQMLRHEGQRRTPQRQLVADKLEGSLFHCLSVARNKALLRAGWSAFRYRTHWAPRVLGGHSVGGTGLW